MFLFKKQNLIKNRIFWVTILLVAVFSVIWNLQNVQAAIGINKQINYQAKLTNASGVSVADGAYDMVFKLYTVDSGGTAIWTGTHTAANGNAVTVTNGVLSVLLGSGTGNTLNLDFSQDAYYLGVTVAADAEMTPRKRIGSVPQAYNANNLVGDGYIKITGAPTGTTVDAGTVYINPVSATSGQTLLGIAVGGTQKFKIDEAGNVVAAGTLSATGANFSGLSASSLVFTDASKNLTSTGTVGVTQGGTGATTQFTAGSIVFAGASGVYSQDNANFFWDDTNKRLGIGTTDPVGSLDIAGGNTSAGTALGDADMLDIAGYINSPYVSFGEYQNYLLQTEAFATTWLRTNLGTVTSNSAISPDGTLLAENIPAETVTDGTGQIYQNVTNSTTGDWTFSVWLKAQSGTANINLRIDSDGETGTNKPITLTTAWKRYSVTQNLATAHTTKTVRILNANNAIAAWGAQLENSSQARVYGGAQTTASVTALTRTMRLRGAANINGALAIVGALTGATTGAFSGAITGTVPTLYVSTDGFVQTAAASTGVTSTLVPLNISPRFRQVGQAWDIDGAANTLKNYWQEVVTYPGNTVNSKLAWYHSSGAMATTAEYQAPEIMNYYNDGLNVLGSSYGSESLTNGTLDAGTSWGVANGFSLASNTAVYVHNASGGTLTQTSANLAVPIKANRWYRFTWTSSAVNTTARAYIDPTGISAERVYLRGTVVTPGTYTTTFKTNASPGDFIITADSAAAGDGFTLDGLSLVEVQSGDIIANGLFTGGGTNGIKIDGSGNVGIGTTNPAIKLSVNGDAGNNALIELRAPSAGNNLMTRVVNDGSEYEWDYGLVDSDGSFRIAQDSVGTDTKLTIIQSGYVGIGDTTPASLFTVGNGDLFQVDSSGSVVTVGDITAGNQSVTGWSDWGMYESITDYATDTSNHFTALQVRDSETTGARGGTFVGLRARGTAASPTAVLASDTIARFEGRGYDGTDWNTTGTARGGMQIHAYNNWSTSDNSTYLVFNTTVANGTAGTERMRIDNNGNVGISTTSPTARLHLPAGTATAGTAPLKLTSGTNLTTPEAGAIEFDGTSLYFTTSTPTRKTIATTTDLHSILTLGTPANGLSLNGQELSLALSSGSTTGALSSTDWTTFNSKFTLPTLTSGSVLFSNGTTINQDNTNFFWDDTNNRLGIGTATPSAKLEVSDGTFLVNNPANPTLTGTYNTTGSAYSVYVSGKYAYVADLGSGLQIIDVSNPASPTLTGTYNTTGTANSVYVSGEYAYVADDATGGLQIIDVSNPASPTLTGTYNTTGTAYSVYVSGKYAYVADVDSGLQIIDVSNPASPTLAGTYDTAGSAYSVYVSGKYAYVADGASGLRIIDVSNPASPTLTGTYNTTGTAWGVYISGKYAYIGDYNYGLQIVDVSNPASPTLTGTYDTSGYAWSVYVSGKYAYVADLGSGLQIVDVSNPASPTLTGTYNTSGSSIGIYISGKYAYVADSTSGLQIIDIFGADIYAANIGNINSQNITVTENIDIGNDLDIRGGLAVGKDIFSNGSLSVYGGGYFSGNVGIGIVSPTARLHLPAGTATAGTAPLKLTSGTSLTTPEAGAIEFDGTDLFYTTSAPTRRTVVNTDAAQTLTNKTLSTGSTWNGTAIGVAYGGTGITTSGLTGVPYITAGTWSVDTNYLALTHGGTNASLTASNGGIVYSTASALAILSANANSGLALVSGGAGAPTWFAPTLGSIVFAGTNGALTQDNSNFFWDDTDKQLGIGTSPNSKLDIIDAVVTTGSILTLGQNTSAFSGDGINMNFANGSGTFTGDFLDFNVNSVNKFKVNSNGRVISDTGTNGGFYLGDGDTGFYENTDDYIYMATGGVNRAMIYSVGFFMQPQGTAYLDTAVSSTTNPTVSPNGQYGMSSGMGGSFGGTSARVSLIAWARESMALYGDNASNSYIITSGLLSAATGDQNAFAINYTTNKATSGNDTGLLINMTDTASPGTSLLIDAQVGGSSKFNVSNAGNGYFAGSVGIGDATPASLFTVGDGDLFQINSSGQVVTGAWQSTVIGAQYGGTGLNGSAASNGQLLIGNGSGYALATITGTTDQVSVANGTGSITLSLPQSIATTSTPAFAGLTTSGHILPSTNDTYDLGSASARWKDLYLGGETIHLGTSATDEAIVSYDTTNNILGIGTDSTTNGDIAFFADDLYLDKSTGYVGIGTASPSAMLSVNGAVNMATISVPGTPVAGDIYSDGTDLFFYNGSGWDDLTAIGSGGISIGDTITSATQGSIFFAGASGVLAQDNTNLFWDDTSKYLGIGDATPSYKLDVAGTVGVSGQLTSTLATGTSPFVVTSTTLNTNLNADLLDGYEASMVAGNSTVVVRNASGYVLANYFNTTAAATTTNASHFAIQTATDGYIRWQIPTEARLSLGLGTTDSPTFATIDTGQGANELYDMNQNVITTSAVTFATINTGLGANELYDMNQNVTTTSGVTFSNLALSNSALFGITIDADGTVDAAGIGENGGSLILSGSGDWDANPHVVVTNGGFLGIGTTGPSVALTVVGNGRVTAVTSGAYWTGLNRTSDGTFTTTTSDIRLKKDVATIDNALSKVMQMRGVTYNWIDPNVPQRMTGMIAQEVMGVMPELVFQNPEDGYYGLLYGETSGLLVEAIKEQQVQISDVTLKTDQNITTLSELQASIDTQLGVIGTSLTSLDARLTAEESKNVDQDSLIATLQTQMAELQAIITPTVIAQIEANTVDISYLKTLLGVDPLNPTDVSITGKLSAETVEGGKLVIKVIDETAATIGTAEITPVLTDADSDGIDDNTGSDGKSVKVMTTVVSADTKIFVTPKSRVKEALFVSNSTAGESFKVEVETPVVDVITFDWWVVEKITQ